MTIPTTTRFYRYQVESLKILFPEKGKHYEIDPKLIKSLVIERDYEIDFFPVIQLNVSLDTELYYMIIEEKLTVRFQIRLQKYIFEENAATAPVKKDVFNAQFVAYIDENTPFLNKAEHKAASEINSASTSPGKTPGTVGGNDLTFYLFRADDIMNSKRIVNTVLSSATMTNAIAYILASLGYTRTLMTPLDNKQSYSEVVLPPLGFLANLVYLENQFGLYHKGAVIFFDLDAFYIINKVPACTAYRKGEFKNTVFMVRDSTNSNKFTSGSYDDDKQKTTFINVFPENIQINTSSVAKDQIEGSHRLIINPFAGFTVDVRSKVDQRGGGTHKVIYNKYNNSFKNNAEKAKIESDGRLKVLAVSDVDISAFTPNKLFTFKYEDSAINKVEGGNFRIVKSVFALTSQGDYMKLDGHATFKK